MNSRNIEDENTQSIIIGWRKYSAFIIAVIVGVTTSFYMEIDYYKPFLTFLEIVSLGFMGINVLHKFGNGRRERTREDID